MQDILEHANATLEIVELEKLWGEELKCNSDTVHTCKVTAVYKVTRECAGPVLWCHGRLLVHLRDVAEDDTECLHCYRSVAHWRVTPI